MQRPLTPTGLKPIGLLSDIDGLRALAVIAVVLFHLRITGLEGGYVGVDIFFVISGFLISGLLHTRIENQTFSFSDFYANRVRRLIPAVLATVIATTAASVVLLQPHMLKDFALSALASIFSGANIVFFLESGYWDSDSDLKPLLHMWSLGVEEQFYLFWPALLLVLARLGKRHYLTGLTALFLASLAACVIYTPSDDAAAFYLLPFRVWQFCLGAMAVEVWRRYSLPLFSQQVLRATGLALCGIAIISFSAETQFPGWSALIPSLGAALVLVAADAREPSPWLSNPVARWFGKISYSLYLVHWPPIALYRAQTLHELDTMAQIGIGLLTLAMAVLLHYGVETRFYRRGHRATGWRGVPQIALVVSVAGGALLFSMYNNPGNYAVKKVVLTADAIEQYKTDRFRLVRRSCRIDKLDNPKLCPGILSSPILFIGNSHEPDAYNALWGAMGGESYSTFINFGSINGCGSLEIAGDWVRSQRKQCQQRLDALYQNIEAVHWRFVVYSALQHLSESRAPLIHMLNTIMTKNPNAELIVFNDYISTNIDCANIINQLGSSVPCGEEPYVEYFGGEPDGSEVFSEELAAITDYTVDKVALLCGSTSIGSCPTETSDGHPMFVDEHHLTWEFAQYLGEKIAAANPPWLPIMRSGDTH